jgi:hypothetical protein
MNPSIWHFSKRTIEPNKERNFKEIEFWKGDISYNAVFYKNTSKETNTSNAGNKDK